MLPRGRAVIEAKIEDREWALDLAENLFPDYTHVDQLPPEQRTLWIAMATGILRGSRTLEPFYEKLTEFLKPALEAQVEDTLVRQNEELQDQRTRLMFDSLAKVNQNDREDQLAREDHFDRQQRRRLKQEKWKLKEKLEEKKCALEEKKWEMEQKERETWLSNNSWRERIGLGLAVVGFLVALVAFIVGFATGQLLFAAGGSGAFAFSALALTLRHVLRREKPAVVPPSPSEKKPD